MSLVLLIMCAEAIDSFISDFLLHFHYSSSLHMTKMSHTEPLTMWQPSPKCGPGVTHFASTATFERHTLIICILQMREPGCREASYLPKGSSGGGLGRGSMSPTLCSFPASVLLELVAQKTSSCPEG